MSGQKILVVFGATGNQGGSVIDSVLADPQTAKSYKIRAITRDPSKPSAKALSDRGCECVTGDLNSKESLHAAIKGAYAVFAVTNYWEKMDEKVELQQGKNLVDIAKEEGVQHFIWSSLRDVTELSGGKYSGVFHFDSKAHVEKYIQSTGLPATFVLAGFYMSNISGGMMRKNEKGDFVLGLPMPPTTPIPLFDTIHDMGKFVKAALKHRDQTLGKRVLAATAYVTPEEIVKGFAVTHPESGKTATFFQVPAKDFKDALMKGRGMPEPIAEEMLQNMQFMDEFGYFGKESLDWSISLLDEKPTTWLDFAKEAKEWKELP